MNIEALLLIIFVSVAAVSLFKVGVRVRERGEELRRAEKALERARASLDARESKRKREPADDSDRKQQHAANWPDWRFYLASRF